MPQLVAGATVSLASGLAAAGLSKAAAFTAAGIIVNLSGSILLSVASNALMSKSTPSANDISRELSLPTVEPPKRFVYGNTRAVGTPVGTPVVGEFIYGCWLVNSRESEGGFSLWFDKRQALYTGDPYDLSGAGATATVFPFLDHVTFWISRGDQTTPPTTFTTEAAFGTGDEDLWKTTDGWQGATVVWIKLKAGSGEERSARWPSSPPVVELQGQFSKVYDPREVTHDIDDRSTWEYSDNWALCIMDAFTQSPVRPYQLKNLDIDLIKNSADVSDEPVAKADLSSEARYRVSGTLVINAGEIEDLVSPMVLSGGGSLTRVGGKLGILAAEYQEPVVTVTNIFGDSFNAIDLVEGDELYNTLRVSYLSADRGYENADLQPYEIPSALTEDGGVPSVQNLNLNFCPSPTQAGRVRKIYGGLIRRQKIVQCVLPPEAFNCVVGSTLTLSLDSPFDIFNGVYEVKEINPGFDMVGDNGVSMLLPATLIKHSADIYDWDENVDEEEILEVPYDGDRSVSSPPTALEYRYFARLGGTATDIRLRFGFNLSTNPEVDEYNINYVDANDSANNQYIINDASDAVDGRVYQNILLDDKQGYVRVRSSSPNSRSAYESYFDFDTNFAILDVTADISTPGEITFNGDTPYSSDYSYMQVMENTVNDFDTATQLGANDTTAFNSPFTVTRTTTAGDKFYWLAAYDSSNNLKAISGFYSLTIS